MGESTSTSEAIPKTRVTPRWADEPEDKPEVPMTVNEEEAIDLNKLAIDDSKKKDIGFLEDPEDNNI
ncbi:hypothetical protein Tco_1572353 [Tanacetum coccineum]